VTRSRSWRWTGSPVSDRHYRGTARRGRGDGSLQCRAAGRRCPGPCRRRIQQRLHAHRGRKDDSLYRARRTLHTGADLLTDKQQDRLDALFGVDDHVEVEVSWWIYQRMIPAYREPDRTKGRELMGMLIDSISHCIPAALIELITLGRTLKKRADDVLATSTGRVRPTDRPRRSTAGSNTSTDPPSGFAISPTTSPDHSWNPGVSGRDYTSDCEEPHIKTPEAIWSLT
jgi:hypothetical protein